jgi:hypothetical protein
LTLHERLEKLTLCYWDTSLGQLLAQKGADIRTAGQRGLKYWVPLLQSKGWDKTQYITVWLDGEVPQALEKPSPITRTDDDVLTPQQITGLKENRDKADFDLSSLLPFRVLVVDGMNRTLALQTLTRSSTSKWKDRRFRLRVLDGAKLEGHKTAIAMSMNEV